VNVIKTKEHVVDDMNPFYQFTNNNTNITVQHDTVKTTEPDGAIMIASVDLNWSTAFQANLTTRLKFSFTSFMSNMILAGNTFNVYNALYHPTEKEIDTLKQQISVLTTAVSDLQIKVATLQADINNFYYTSEEYTKNNYFHEGALVWIDKGTLYQVNESYTTTDDPDISVRDAFNTDIAMGRLIPVRTAE
jgi:hypothetical protein